MTDTPGAANDLERARQGDREALDRLLSRARGRLERSARSLIGDELRLRVQASDVLQATYLDVLGSIAGFRGQTEEAFCRWLVRVLVNNVRDASKYSRAGKRAVDREARARCLRSEVGVVDPRPSPSRELAFAEELLQVSRALAELPPDYQRIILLRARLGLSHAQAGREMGRSVAASRVLLARARAALLVRLERQRG